MDQFIIKEAQYGYIIVNQKITGQSYKLPIIVEQLDFTSFAMVLTQIGGTFSVFYGIISLVTKIIHLTGWENNVLTSVFGTLNLDEETIRVFRQRISYIGLY